MWLEVASTNNNPKVIAGYYKDCVLSLGGKISSQTVVPHFYIYKSLPGCPAIIRADRGTENVHVARIQRHLRRNGEDSFAGEKSYMYGRSTANQVRQLYNPGNIDQLVTVM